MTCPLLSQSFAGERHQKWIVGQFELGDPRDLVPPPARRQTGGGAMATIKTEFQNGWLPS